MSDHESHKSEVNNFDSFNDSYLPAFKHEKCKRRCISTHLSKVQKSGKTGLRTYSGDLQGGEEHRNCRHWEIRSIELQSSPSIGHTL